MSVCACCWWSFAGRTGEEARPTESNRAVVDLFKDATAAQWWGMIAVCASLVGGMALIALGIGLQHDISPRGRVAKWVTGLFAAYFLAYLCATVFSFPVAGRIVTVGVMTSVWSAMFLLAGASADQLGRLQPIRRDSKWSRRDEDDLRNDSLPRPPGGTSR